MTNSWYKTQKLHQNLTFISIGNKSYAICFPDWNSGRIPNIIVERFPMTSSYLTKILNGKLSPLKVVFFNFSIFQLGFLSQKQNALWILVGKTDVFRLTHSWYKRKKLHQNLTFMSIRKNSSYAINVHQMNGLSRISIQIEKQALELSRPWRLMPNIRSIYLYWL